ncbi:hypothetical protein EBQ91_00615 [bacterium]|nr:hypothetical protein [bacterium]
MNKRERLLSTLLDKDFSQEKAKILDTTVRFILSDMGKMYIDFWNTEGPGVMVFQPTSQERSMFYWTLQEIYLAKETCEQENNDDLAESLRRIFESAQKINPESSAGYIINDNDGIRYFQIEYNQLTDQ